MDEHTETHRVETEDDLVATFDSLLAAFGYDAVKAAWMESSGDGDEISSLRRQLFLSANVIDKARVLVYVGYDRRLNDYKAAFGKLERALLVYDDLTKPLDDEST